MNTFDNLKNWLAGIDWNNPDNITRVVVVFSVLFLTISLFFKNTPIRKFFDGLVQEMKTVEWLKGKEVLFLTAITILVSGIAIAIMAPLDTLFVYLKTNYLLN